jgi:Tol biopolymer transport system component
MRSETEFHDDIHQFLDRVAREASGVAIGTPGAVRKARRRLALSGVVGALGIAVVAAGTVAGVRALTGPDRTIPGHTASPHPRESTRSFYQPSIIGLDGTVQRAVRGLPPDADSLSLSPDGHTVAFRTFHHGRQQVGVVGIDGTALRVLTDLPANDSTPSWSIPAWSPDGSRIAFVAEGHVFVVHADGSGLRRITSGPGIDQWPTWSPDGSTIAYSSGRAVASDGGFSPSQEIWTVPVGGGPPTRLTHNRVSDDMPAYSPDGSRIAITRYGEIWTMDRNGGHAQRLAGQPPGPNWTPRWSPDGSRIAFQAFYPKKRSGALGVLASIHVVDLATGRFTRLPGEVATDQNSPSWLPSGTALLVNRYPADEEVPTPQ